MNPYRIVKTWCSETKHYGYDPKCRAEAKGETYLVIETKPCTTGGGTPDPIGDDLMDGSDGNPSIGGFDTTADTALSPNDPLYIEGSCQCPVEHHWARSLPICMV